MVLKTFKLQKGLKLIVKVTHVQWSNPNFHRFHRISSELLFNAHSEENYANMPLTYHLIQSLQTYLLQRLFCEQRPCSSVVNCTELMQPVVLQDHPLTERLCIEILS